MAEQNARLGKYGEYTPQLCAVTNQYLGTRPQKTIKLSDEYYCRVLSKANGYDTKAIKKELLRATKRTTKTQVTSEEVSNDK